MSDVVVRDADECARAIQRALAAMDPPIDVYEGIVKLIADFLSYGTSIGAIAIVKTARARDAFVVPLPTYSDVQHGKTERVDAFERRKDRDEEVHRFQRMRGNLSELRLR